MIRSIYATKIGMTQAWTKKGLRVPVTRCKISENVVLSMRTVDALNTITPNAQKQECYLLEVGFGQKKLKNMKKPLREKVKKSGFSFGLKKIGGLKAFYKDEDEKEQISNKYKVGSILDVQDILEVGDITKVQGKSKGRGFAGVMKRHGFSGGPRTHGQSDRERAPGAIGAHTDPGRVWKGKKMPGHMGNVNATVLSLTVLHIDPKKNEIWLSGPVPGSINSTVRITKMGKKNDMVLDFKASGIEVEVPEKSSDTKVSGDKVVEAKKDIDKKPTEVKDAKDKVEVKKQAVKEEKKSDKKVDKKEASENKVEEKAKESKEEKKEVKEAKKS